MTIEVPIGADEGGFAVHAHFDEDAQQAVPAKAFKVHPNGTQEFWEFTNGEIVRHTIYSDQQAKLREKYYDGVTFAELGMEEEQELLEEQLEQNTQAYLGD
jgi:hypothetical protein